MPYRVETALSKRSGCQATECKNNGIKIDKDELRLGTWVEFKEQGSWTWRHWGCVSGKTLQNIREALEDPAKPGTYRWDYLDGYEGGEKNSLDRHPDLQEKVRRVITQGFIDPEDFNGDAEMNKLGETGLRTAESKKRMRDEKKTQTNRIKELEAQLAAIAADRSASLATGGSPSKMDVQLAIVQDALNEQNNTTQSPAKRKVKPETDGEEEVKPAAKKKRATKAEKDGEAVMQAKTPRARKFKQEESDDYEGDEPVAAKPARKSRAKKVVKAEEDEEDANDLDAPAPKKRASRGKKAIIQEEEAGKPSEAKPVGKRGRKSVKEQRSEHNPMPEASSAALVGRETANTTLLGEPKPSAAIKNEPSEAVNLNEAPTVHDEYGLSTETKAEPSEAVDMASAAPAVNVDSQDTARANVQTSESQADSVAAEAETESQPKKKSARGKRVAAPVVTNSRGSRSRTASKA